MAKLSFHAYTVVDYKQGGKRRSKWLKIGAAFSHKDGEGFDIVLAALPVNGRVALRKPKSKEALAAAHDDEDEEDGARAWLDGERVRF